MDILSFVIGICIGAIIFGVIILIFYQYTQRADEMINKSVFLCDTSIIALQLRGYYNYFDKYINYINKINKCISSNPPLSVSRVRIFDAYVLFNDRTVCGIGKSRGLFILKPLHFIKDDEGNEILDTDENKSLPPTVTYDFNRYDCVEDEYLSTNLKNIITEYNKTLKLKGDISSVMATESDFGIIAYYVPYDFRI